MAANQMTYNSISHKPDSQALLTICHRIHKSYRSTNIESIAFLVIDVDSFYAINDTFGRETGDKLLKQIGEALFNTVQEIHSRNLSEDGAANFKCCEFYHPDNNRFFVLISVSSEEEALNYGQIILMRNKSFNV